MRLGGSFIFYVAARDRDPVPLTGDVLRFLSVVLSTRASDERPDQAGRRIWQALETWYSNVSSRCEAGVMFDFTVENLTVSLSFTSCQLKINYALLCLSDWNRRIFFWNLPESFRTAIIRLNTRNPEHSSSDIFSD